MRAPSLAASHPLRRLHARVLPPTAPSPTCRRAQDQKTHIREEFQRCNTEREVLRNDLREMRSKVPRGTKLDTVEADIAALEFRLSHAGLAGNDEKRAQQQLTQLLAARPLAATASVMEERLKVTDATRASTKHRLDACDAVLNGIKEKQATEDAALDMLRGERESTEVDFAAIEVSTWV